MKESAILIAFAGILAVVFVYSLVIMDNRDHPTPTPRPVVEEWVIQCYQMGKSIFNEYLYKADDCPAGLIYRRSTYLPHACMSIPEGSSVTCTYTLYGYIYKPD